MDTKMYYLVDSFWNWDAGTFVSCVTVLAGKIEFLPGRVFIKGGFVKKVVS